uniref:Uncharacterized protein n=1 Tax=Rhizophora mucronata TaxID=61149 RepID=A0A2P2LWN9_RHIMU
MAWLLVQRLINLLGRPDLRFVNSLASQSNSPPLFELLYFISYYSLSKKIWLKVSVFWGAFG